MFPQLRGQATAGVASVLAFVALAVNSVAAILQVRQIADAEAWVVHTHRVLETVQAVLTDVLSAETGQRGFLITGEQSYLGPYRDGIRNISRDISQLEELTRDNVEQRERIDSLRPLLARKLDELERTVQLRSSGPAGLDLARGVVLGGEGKALMDRMRGEVTDMLSHENILLADRARRAAAARRKAVVTTVFGFAVGLGLLSGAFRSFRRRVREREDAAALLYREKERFRATLTSIGDAVIVTDDAGRITMMNPTACAITGWGEDGVGRSLADVFHIVNEETREPVESPVTKVLRTGQVTGLANHTVLVRHDGSEVPIDDSGAPVHDRGEKVVGVVLVFRDIRERREMERELTRRAERLQEQDRRKDEFLALLSHELRNPLAPIRNAVTLLRRPEVSGNQARRARDVIDRQVAQMARLVEDLLDVSRIAEGKIRLKKELVNLTEAVRRTVDDHRSLFQRKGIAVTYHGAPEPAWIEADATRVAQIVGNLLQNAAKFTNAGGHVDVVLTAEEGHAVLRVRDDGEGMDEATLGKLFQTFVQAERTLARTQGGLGLGLALARRLVELQGGTVTASSEGLGLGTEFVVKLPLAEVSAVPSAGISIPSGLTRQVLLVEDNGDAAETLRDVLELEGHQVQVVHSGQDAIDTALAQQPDVVLCDLGLPDLDGFEVARRLRAAGSGSYLVALTGYVSPTDAERARQAGFDAHLAKPPDLPRLLAVLAGAPAAGRSREVLLGFTRSGQGSDSPPA